MYLFEELRVSRISLVGIARQSIRSNSSLPSRRDEAFMPQEVLGFDVASVSLLPSALLVSSFISARWRSLACSPFPLALQLYLPCLSARSWLPGMPSPLRPALSRTNCRSPPQVASSLFVASITRRRAEESRVQGWSSGRLSSWGPEILEGSQIRFFIMKWGESKTTRKTALPSFRRRD